MSTLKLTQINTTKWAEMVVLEKRKNLFLKQKKVRNKQKEKVGEKMQVQRHKIKIN